MNLARRDIWKPPRHTTWERGSLVEGTAPPAFLNIEIIEIWLKSAFLRKKRARNVHETWWRNDEVCVWLHPSLFGHGLGSDRVKPGWNVLWMWVSQSFPTKPGKMRKMCKMMHVLNVLRVELWKKLDAMRHPIQAGSLSVVFPKCSGHVHLYFGRYLLDCRCDELWDVCTLGGPWMLSPCVSMSTVSTVFTVSTVSTAQDALHELPESHPTLPTSPGAAGGESQGAAGEGGDVSHNASSHLGAAHWAHFVVDLVRHGLRC